MGTNKQDGQEIVPDRQKLGSSKNSEKTYKLKNLKTDLSVPHKKTYHCTFCNYKTIHYSNVFVHMRIHTKEMPYFCGSCGYRSSQGNTLKMHIISKHGGDVGSNFNIDNWKRVKLRVVKKRNNNITLAPFYNGRPIFDIPKEEPPFIKKMSKARASNKSFSISELAKSDFSRFQQPNILDVQNQIDAYHLLSSLLRFRDFVHRMSPYFINNNYRCMAAKKLYDIQNAIFILRLCLIQKKPIMASDLIDISRILKE